MRLKGFLIFFFSFFYIHGSFAQVQGELTQSRILILLDESSSMIQKWPNSKEKYKAADELINRLMDSIYTINPDVEFSLRVFGHQYTVEQNNCYDTKNEVPFSKDNRTQMSLRLDDIRPLGVTPIAYALMQAAQFDLVDEDHNAYSIILFTDGGESCGGDICEVMKKLRKYKVYFKPYIVSLEDDPTLKTTYSCMGDFLQVTKDADMPKAVTTIVNAFRPALKITKVEYKQLQTMAANLPSPLKVDIPVINPDLQADTSSIKVESEAPVQKPVKTFRDTVAAPVVKDVPKPKQPKTDTVAAPKPVSKIKVDVPFVKPPAEKIAHLALSEKNLLYTKVQIAKAPEFVSIPPVKINIPNAPEDISTVKPHQLLLADIPAPAVIAARPVPVPAIEIKVKSEPEQIAGIKPLTPYLANTPISSPTKIAMVTPPPAPPIVVPVTITPESVARTSVLQLRPFPTYPPLNPKFAKRTIPPLPLLVITDTLVAPVAPVVTRKKEMIARLQTSKVESRHTMFVIEDKVITPRKVPPLPPLKIDIPKTAVTKTQPVDNDVPFKTAQFKVDIEDAKETSVEVYITDGHGKFYNSTPQMLLLEPGTGKIIKAFYRTVDASGNPDPLTNLPVGTYNLSLSDKRTLGLKNVKIQLNKKNRITVIVPPASLYFYYDGAPKRPVTEFVARVTERNKAQGRVQDQKCTEELEYAGGNYHIMINTFPQIDRNTDIDFGETGIAIPQPGFVNFMHDDKIQLVVLYKQEGDKFLSFHTLDLKDPSTQPLRIQPGEYQAHYHSGPGGNSYANEKVVTFFVKATKTTDVELK